MLNLAMQEQNTWAPPALTRETIEKCIEEASGEANDYLCIFRTEPYVDALYIAAPTGSERDLDAVRRFTFCKDYVWSNEEEIYFTERCLHNPDLRYTETAMDEIFKYYMAKHPEWNLKRYYTRAMCLLDHMYHCMIQGTAKEMLYKAGLDYLAENMEDMDEVNLIADKPSELYDGVSMRALRALNCRAGSLFLGKREHRAYVKELQMRFPDIFKEPLNNAQCKYLSYLCEGGLTTGEAGRIFQARRKDLFLLWSRSQYEMFIWGEKLYADVKREADSVANIDPIYREYVSELRKENAGAHRFMIENLTTYLTGDREENDKKIRRANRKRNQDWQERDKGYVMRFPQTINDFCRDAVYMRNCLLAYAEAVMQNDTTILFMRKPDDVNKPFIDIEIYKGELMQAYHRYNEDCSEEEAAWIIEYCKRHEIGYNRFKFNRRVDRLF